MRRLVPAIAAVITAGGLLGTVVSRVSVVAATGLALAGPVLRITLGETVAVKKKGYGRLDVNVEPERARVFVNSQFRGRGDRRLVLPPGTHRVRVVLNDGREASESVRIDAGRVTHVRLELR